ncbi:hypothetical protein HQ520_07175 [bacterium]|nr:hypothetical protein [bacterium]
MWLKWLPWQYIVRKLARSHGFLDPIALMAYARRFSQPSEVQEPIELLRAGVVFHARGLMNSRAIQHNLDWVWPYWVERQFDPGDESFVPRAFSLTHINLTHRNWTAVGVPDSPALPIVDPRGLLTPLFDGWSLDGWIIAQDGAFLIPSQLPDVEQVWNLEGNLSIQTTSSRDGMSLQSHVEVRLIDQAPYCYLRLSATSERPASLVVSLRPYNPEGVSFLHHVELSRDRMNWAIEGEERIRFSDPVEKHTASDYRTGDVFLRLQNFEERNAIICDVGMSTAAAIFELRPGVAREIVVGVPLPEEENEKADLQHPAVVPDDQGWNHALQTACRIQIPDPQMQFLYDAALRSLILHSPKDVYPGPYTYKRFWFRDAAFLLNAMLCAGFTDRVERSLDAFPPRQTPLGYFLSQEGEWDSNGEALWIMRRWCEVAHRHPKSAWLPSIHRGAHWIIRKRDKGIQDSPHKGLFPPGFSAEHLGLNDYYYWDDFWGVAGLRSAAFLTRHESETEADAFNREADAFMADIENSIEQTRQRLERPAMPAAPYRRLDAGSIGSLAVGYPLQLWPAQDARLTDTVQFLLDNCLFRGAFLQDMIHSGLNAYLTLHMAQVLMKAGDLRFIDLIRSVAQLASPTGQWPEAIHPRTGGGCMGDGQHVWAAAEWIVMIRNCFVYEEPDRECLVLGAGLLPEWLEPGEPIRIGPAPTSWGMMEIDFQPNLDRILVEWRGKWHERPPRIEIRVPGHVPAVAEAGQTYCEVLREPNA